MEISVQESKMSGTKNSFAESKIWPFLMNAQP